MSRARFTPRVLIGGILLALVGAGSVGMTATADDTATASGPASARVRIVTYNVSAAASVARTTADVRSLAASGADIITLQEMGSAAKRAAVRSALVTCSMCPYEAYTPTAAVPGSTPIYYRWARFSLVEIGTKQVSDDTFVGARGAGPSTLRAKYINWVRLRERATGKVIYVLNNHTVPTVQGPTGGANDNTKRVALYTRHMEVLKVLVNAFKSTGAAVFVTGDLNVNYRRDKVVRDEHFPYANLHQVGMKASHEPLGEPLKGTHKYPGGSDMRLIDYVYFTEDAVVKAAAQRVLFDYASDHRPLSVDFTFTSTG